MRWTARLAWALILAFGLFFSRSALADGAVPDAPTQKPSAEDLAKAKKLFETGLKLFNESAFDVALADFEQSYRLAGRPSALRNLAQCHRSMHHFVEAYETYDALLARHAAELSPSDKNLVLQAKDELGSLSGTITIVAPAGVALVVDGRPVGTAPLPRPMRVTLGLHKIAASRDGFLPFAGEVSVAPGQDARVEATLALEPLVGRVAVRELHDRPVHVLIDGKDMGPAPFEGEIAAGDHVIEATGEKFSAERRNLTVVKKERAEITLDAVSVMGTLRVAATPANAQITVDGKVVGVGTFQGDLSAGAHSVSVTADGYKEVTRPITVDRGQTLALELPLATNAPPPRGSDPADYRGVYVRLNLDALIGPGMPDNGAPPVSTTSSQPTFGGGLSVRVGYAFHWLAAEIVGTGLTTFANQSINLAGTSGANGGASQQSYKIDQNGPAGAGFIGAGARVTSRDDTFRFTFGLTPGVAIRTFRARIDSSGSNSGSTCLGGGDPACNGGGSGDDLSIGYTTFGLRADAGILMGSTPGTKFFIGVQSWLDFPPGTLAVGPDTTSRLPNNAFAAPGRGIYVVSGSPQVLVGPELGIQFGR